MKRRKDQPTVPANDIHEMPALGVGVYAAVFPHPATNADTPALLFRFALADGTTAPGMLLFLEDDQWDGFVRLLTDAIAGARRAAAAAEASDG